MTELSHIVLEDGNINISEDVISTIAKLATDEIEGVVSITKGFTHEIGEMLGIKHLSNMSAKVDPKLNDDEVRINLSIAVEYGYNIKELAVEVQKNVKEKIENMTGLDVIEVDVSILNIVAKADELKE